MGTMSDVFKTALRELRDDLDRLRDDLENSIARIVGVDEYAADDILEEDDDGSVRVDVAELKALLERLDCASEAADDAFNEFDEEAERAWRRFRQALLQYSEMGANP